MKPVVWGVGVFVFGICVGGALFFALGTKQFAGDLPRGSAGTYAAGDTAYLAELRSQSAAMNERLGQLETRMAALVNKREVVVVKPQTATPSQPTEEGAGAVELSAESRATSIDAAARELQMRQLRQQQHELMLQAYQAQPIDSDWSVRVDALLTSAFTGSDEIDARSLNSSCGERYCQIEVSLSQDFDETELITSLPKDLMREMPKWRPVSFGPGIDGRNRVVLMGARKGVRWPK